ncbi:translocation/assembly module TamB domain-containing protein [Thauera sinica]|uniref:Dicarboxylate transport domain-containing protein n=1 Tax=Thauera sinica TaxID=2665146 RepID=A0ABW1AUP6_9RHOO|nr:hypothetical protein [Thauera sp. K11]ATE59354.1 hypothetical protein CCZ27_04775 [Thauera sp. K11]
MPAASAALPAIEAGRVRLSVARIDHPAFSVRDLSVRFEADESRLQLALGRLRIGGDEFRDLRFDCPQGRLSYPLLSCRGGQLRVARKGLPWRVDFHADLTTGEADLVATSRTGARVAVRAGASGGLHARIERFPLSDAAALLGSPAIRVADWKPVGIVHGELDWSASGAGAARQGRLTVRGTLEDGGFGSADGQHAAEKLGLVFALEAGLRNGRWQWTARADWREGAAYWHPFFVEAGARLDAGGVMQGDRFEVREAALQIAGVDALAATAVLDTRHGRLIDGTLSVSGADLAVVGPRWVAPLIAPEAAARLRFAGHVGAVLAARDGVLQAVDAVFDDAGFSLPAADGGGGVAFGPVSGRLPWRTDGATQAELHIGGGRWEKLALGPFSLSARLERDRVSFARSVIPLLDGAAVLDGLALQRVGDGWAGSGGAVIEPVSMRLLTEAAGLPSMGGVLSASIPALSVRPGEIAFDGALVISLFDGYLQATNLRLREPFGVASYLSADVEARHIDLAQLTETFSFGSITGFIDADVRGLELVRWRPVRFDARVASSPGRYPRRISQRAVENISALGGPGAMAAIQRSLIGLFDTFGYRDLGFRCVLEADVCLADGVGDTVRADGGFAIVRGGGVPALDVIGYNRRIDWKELVERLQRVTDGKLPPEVR